MFSEVKDEDSDMDVPEDEGSDSDMEECRPSKPRPTRNGITTGQRIKPSHVVTRTGPFGYYMHYFPVL